jgi:hypothetical protein
VENEKMTPMTVSVLFVITVNEVQTVRMAFVTECLNFTSRYPFAVQGK